MKARIGIICLLGIIALIAVAAVIDFKISIRFEDFHSNFGISSILASDSVGATVTPKLVSITITTDGTVAYGTLDLDGETTTINLTDTQTVENNGSVTADFTIMSSDAVGGATPWTLVTATGSADEFIHKFATDGGNIWTTFAAADPTTYTFVDGIAASDTAALDLFIGIPSETTVYDAKSITVTLQASE